MQDSSSANTASLYNKASASALLKSANGATNSKSSSGGGGVIIHVSNRPKKHQTATSAKDFPSLPGASLTKANLETDFNPPPSLSMSAAVSSKHRNLVESYESVGGRDPDTKLSLVQRSANGGAIKKTTTEKVAKIDSVNMFPAGGGGIGTFSMTPSTWVTKKPSVKSKKAKVAPPPLSTSTVANFTSSTITLSAKSSGRHRKDQTAGEQIKCGSSIEERK